MRNDAAFHSYLWRLMKEQPLICRRDRHVVHRCLQLSLRLATRLKYLSVEHSHVLLCAQAMRGVCEEVVSEEGGGWGQCRSCGGEAGAMVMDLGGQGQGGLNRRHFSGLRQLSMWERYLCVVDGVVAAWAVDMEAYCLDPLWLLPKLRTHRHW
ncbi:unnamed protein product [Choristocarpus tenellus]